MIKEKSFVYKSLKSYSHNSIYMIRNTINDKCYIGRSVSPKTRLLDHLSQLRRGKGFKEMQKDFDKYGEETFETNILEEHLINEHDPVERENFYINKYDSITTGYNKVVPSHGRNSKQFSTTVNATESNLIKELAGIDNISTSKWIRNLIVKELGRRD